jgi:AcrR family transcriptional regulator
MRDILRVIAHIRNSHRGKENAVPQRVRTQPRKQAVQERSLATVEAILAATARILVKDGYDRASTNRVALAAGVSIGSLYQYFPSKEALVAALIERHVEQMSGVAIEAFPRLVAMPLGEAVREIVRLMVEAHAVDPKLHKVLVEQVPRVGRMEKMLDIEGKMTALARAYFEAHREEIREVDLDLAAFVVVRAVEALTHAAVLSRPELLRTEVFAEEVAVMLTRYLAADAPGAAPLARLPSRRASGASA